MNTSIDHDTNQANRKATGELGSKPENAGRMQTQCEGVGESGLEDAEETGLGDYTGTAEGALAGAFHDEL
jgi:hypothetical protein